MQCILRCCLQHRSPAGSQKISMNDIHRFSIVVKPPPALYSRGIYHRQFIDALSRTSSSPAVRILGMYSPSNDIVRLRDGAVALHIWYDTWMGSSRNQHTVQIYFIRLPQTAAHTFLARMVVYTTRHSCPAMLSRF